MLHFSLDAPAMCSVCDLFAAALQFNYQLRGKQRERDRERERERDRWRNGEREGTMVCKDNYQHEAQVSAIDM